MIEAKLRTFMQARKRTLLGVGPMSKNCTDAAIELSNEFQIPLMLIASRRQIECAEQGAGYVNSWSTQDFAKYVFEADKRGHIILARDHGGPWQSNHEVEKQLSLRMAMNSAKQSFEVDILNGFQFIHIDPSIDIFEKPNVETTLDRLFELYDFCWSVARKNNKDILFEIGTEEQSGGSNTIEEIEFILDRVNRFCTTNHLPKPFMIVVQTGTRVMEMRNVGAFDSPFRIAGEIPFEIQLPRLLDLCERREIFMKEHNGDYLSDEALAWHPRLGIHATNVAPEFGVAESKKFYELLQQNELGNFADRFVSIALASEKYKKWLTPNSNATSIEKALMCGHYVFSSPNFLKLKKEVSGTLEEKQIDLDKVLKLEVKKSIFRYLKNFRMV